MFKPIDQRSLSTTDYLKSISHEFAIKHIVQKRFALPEHRRAITFPCDNSQLKIQLQSAPSTSITKLDQLKAQ